MDPLRPVSDPSSPEAVANRLRRLRENTRGRHNDRHISRDQLAHHLDVSTSTIRNWEKDGAPKTTHLIALHQTTGVSLDWLVLGVGPTYLPGRDTVLGRVEETLPA